MGCGEVNIAEEIRKILEGRDIESAKDALIEQVGDSVVPVLEALAGKHGQVYHPDPKNPGATTSHLVDVLVGIAKRDVEPLAAALADHLPGENLVAYAIGHSGSDHADEILKDFKQHGDEVLGAIANHHRPD